MWKEICNKLIIKNNDVFILGFIILSFLFDFINKVEIYYSIDFIKFSRILKLLLLIYALKFIITHFKYVFNNIRFVLYASLIISIVFLLKNNYSILYLNEYIRYIFILVILPLIYKTYVNKKTNSFQKLYSIFKVFIIINFLLILIGLIFEIKIFKSYDSSRFGYNGIILSQGVTPYVYLTATVLFWTLKDKIMLTLTLLLCAVSGIKGVYFVEFLILILLLLYDKNFSKKFKIKSALLILLSFIILLLLLFISPTFQKVMNSDGLLSVIFSYRIDYTLEVFNQLKSTDFSILIGVITLPKVRLEMQLVDLYLFFGIFGLITYLFFIYFITKTLVRTKISKAFVISALSLSVLSGNLLYIPLASFLFLITLIFVDEYILIKRLN